MFKVSELVECGFVDGVNAWAIMNMQLHCYTMLQPSDLKVHCAWQVVNQALWIVRAEWDDVGCIGSQLAALF